MFLCEVNRELLPEQQAKTNTGKVVGGFLTNPLV